MSIYGLFSNGHFVPLVPDPERTAYNIIGDKNEKYIKEFI